MDHFYVAECKENEVESMVKQNGPPIRARTEML